MTLFIFHCSADPDHKLLIASKQVPQSAIGLCKAQWVFEKEIGTDVKQGDVLLGIGDSTKVLADIAAHGYHEARIKWTVNTTESGRRKA